MANIHEYLAWRGDIPISRKFKFNEIDSMILCRLSYMPFDKIKLRKVETIASISRKMTLLDKKNFLWKGDKELMELLGKSARFKNMLITDYIKTLDNDIEKQFGVITIHLSVSEMYISFLGTDDSLVGWKEDFNMSFMDNVPCEIDGLNYLNKLALKYFHKKIRLGGHSKGGTVAIYSAIACRKNVQRRIIKVDNFDGPGLNENILKKYADSKMFKKLETYIPQESIIGRILNHKEKVTIASSLEKGLFEHDLYSWQINVDKIVKLQKNTKMSEHFNRALVDWFKNTTIEQRKIFINTAFQLLSKAKITSLLEIVESIPATVPKILKKYKEITPQEKKVISDMIKKLIMSYIKTLRSVKPKISENLEN